MAPIVRANIFWCFFYSEDSDPSDVSAGTGMWQEILATGERPPEISAMLLSIMNTIASTAQEKVSQTNTISSDRKHLQDIITKRRITYSSTLRTCSKCAAVSETPAASEIEGEGFPLYRSSFSANCLCYGYWTRRSNR